MLLGSDDKGRLRERNEQQLGPSTAACGPSAVGLGEERL